MSSAKKADVSKLDNLDLPLDARFELWLHPSDGGPGRKIIETTVRISGVAKT